VRPRTAPSAPHHPHNHPHPPSLLHTRHCAEARDASAYRFGAPFAADWLIATRFSSAHVPDCPTVRKEFERRGLVERMPGGGGFRVRAGPAAAGVPEAVAPEAVAPEVQTASVATIAVPVSAEATAAAAEAAVGVIAVASSNSFAEVVSNVFVGDRCAAECLPPRVRHVVNATQREPCHHERDGVRYLRVDVDDNEMAPIHKSFATSNAFIAEALVAGDAVLVHCASGISRCVPRRRFRPSTAPASHRRRRTDARPRECSATVSRVCVCAHSSATLAMAFLMARHGTTFAEAQERVRGVRPQAQPNPGFVRQLERYERELGRGGSESVGVS
jgi:protein-tyrosine phosphatase